MNTTPRFFTPYSMRYIRPIIQNKKQKVTLKSWNGLNQDLQVFFFFKYNYKYTWMVIRSEAKLPDLN